MQRQIIRHVIAIALFLGISGVYYLPALSGKVLNQSDNIQAKGLQTEQVKYREATGKEPLWTNSAFGGMPSYQVHHPAKANLTKYVNKFLLLGGRITVPYLAMFLTMAMFYILLLVLGVDWRMGILGSIAFGLGTYNVVITEAGHSTKLITIAYVAPMIAGILLTFRGKYLLGGALTALFLSLQLNANHIQITYYLFLALLILGVIQVIKAAKEKAFPQFSKAAGVLVLAGLIGVGTNISRLWTTYEYTAETTRGKTELTVKGAYSPADEEANPNGLSKSYAFDWSYGVQESFSVLIPNYMGGSSSNSLAYDIENNKPSTSDAGRIAQQIGQQDRQLYSNLVNASTSYWGDQRFVSGPIYFGAIICFLFVLGIVLTKGTYKTWAISGAVLMFMLGWGENFPIFNYFMFDHFPMFNKFRSVSMALSLANIFFISLGLLGLKELVGANFAQKEKLRAIYIATGVTGGLCVLLYLAASLGFLSFSGINDAKLLTSHPDLLEAVKSGRASMMKSDTLRSLLLIVLAAGALWAYVQKRINWQIALVVVGVLAIGDLWMVDKRFVNESKFEERNRKAQIAQPRPVDQQVMNDVDPHFRVLDFSKGTNPYADGTPSYFHKSLGGYHAAKMRLFQDLSEHYLYNFNPTSNMNITGMLNVKYFILQNPQNGQPIVSNNTKAMGNAWLVKGYKFVDNADQEIAALGNLEMDLQAVVQKKYADYLAGLGTQDSTGAYVTPHTAGEYIKLTAYHPDHMTYEVKTVSERLGMFSEMYYPAEKGWNVYIDGKKIDSGFIKANYAIRGMRLPAGEYTLDMKFEPRSFYTGERIALFASLLVIGLAGFSLFKAWQGYTPPPVEEKPAAPPVKEKRQAAKKANRKQTQRKKKGKKK